MPKRLVTCPVIGDGATKATRWRAKVADYGIPYVSAIHSDPVTGAPTHTVTLAMIGAATLAELQPCMADPEVRVIPFGRLDDPLSSFNQTQRDAMRDAALDVGVPQATIDAFTGATLLGEVVRAIGQAIEPSFLEDARHFDIGIPGE